MRDILNAVYFLHSNSIIHGDLKGANILVNDSGRACIADLGFSRLTTTAVLTWATIQSSPSLGTVPWQAPELLENYLLDKLIVPTTASDVYALGCLCYEVM
jgi:serine/threonine protein kinase